MAQIINITSEALQATIRRLLPSQQGFGEDLQASNVVTPIIDLTPTAEGSLLSESLQQASAYGSITNIGISPSTTQATIINSTGFWLLDVKIAAEEAAVNRNVANFELYDGATYKGFKNFYSFASSVNINFFAQDKFVLFLAAGESIVVTTGVSANVNGNYRQIADVNGNLVNPSGFTSE